jgi:hypothetical protein
VPHSAASELTSEFCVAAGTALEKQLASIDAAKRVKSGSVEVHLQASAVDGVTPGGLLQVAYTFYSCPQQCVRHLLHANSPRQSLAYWLCPFVVAEIT